MREPVSVTPDACQFWSVCGVMLVRLTVSVCGGLRCLCDWHELVALPESLPLPESWAPMYELVGPWSLTCVRRRAFGTCDRCPTAFIERQLDRKRGIRAVQCGAVNSPCNIVQSHSVPGQAAQILNALHHPHAWKQGCQVPHSEGLMFGL